mmetsp:Transcript_19467/g.17251  ORF Transcript_19467/g.17251 Transcript_19467/m.17251 type:complete len:211 (+) Transcript_19467:169-801(+)
MNVIQVLTTKKKSLQNKNRANVIKRIIMKKGKKHRDESLEETSTSPKIMKNVSSMHTLHKSRCFDQRHDQESSKLKIKNSRRGPFPSERLYNLGKIRSSNQNLFNLQTSKGRNVQDDSLYKYVGAPYDSSGMFKDDRRLKMPNLFKNSRSRFKRRFKNSLSRQQNNLEGTQSKSRFASRIMSMSPESTRVNTTGLNSPRSKNGGNQSGFN